MTFDVYKYSAAMKTLTIVMSCQHTKNSHCDRCCNEVCRKKQTWGELIVNANALLMHYFFPVIQGND